MFKKKNLIRIAILALISASVAGYYAYTEYNRRNPSMADTTSSFQLLAADVLNAFESKPEEAKKQYIDQVLEVSGPVKVVEKDEKGFYTVVLGEEGSMSSVRCVVDSMFTERAAKLVSGSSTTLRGVCVGYTTDDMGLGADLLLNRCYPLP